MSKTKITVRFDQESHTWLKQFDYNRIFLETQFNWANDLLQARGHLFLNEVYDMLGLPRTSEGQLLGWLYTPDTRIKFMQSEPDADGAIDLEFMVDGEIYNKIGK